MPCYYPATRYGGPVTSVHELVKQLVIKGIDVTVYTTSANGNEELDVDTDKEIAVDGVRVNYFRRQFPRGYFRSPSMARALEERIHSFDVLHIHWMYVYTTRIAARLCIQYSVPYLLSPRGMLDIGAIRKKGAFKKKLYLHCIENRHIQKASVVHFTSFGEKYRACLPSSEIRSEVIHNGIDIAAIRKNNYTANTFLKRYPDSAKKKRVLFIGRINYIKGLDLLAEAWPIVVEEIPYVQLIIVGPDDHTYANKVHQWFTSYECRDTVVFTGILAGPVKYSAIASADVLVCPSYLESFGMAIVEALALATPVVVTNRVNICDDIAKAKCGLITPTECNQLARALVSILRDSEEARQMGRRGQILVERQFSLDTATDKTMAVYKSLWK